MVTTDQNILIPSARRLMTSLRDLGYEFHSAVADIVDNALEAQASRVNIDVEFDGDESWVRIVDNGDGMSRAELTEAMRYGSDRQYKSESLGKFGLGLKTASLSQCQRLSVATRNDSKRREIAAYAWDLEHIAKTDKWEILTLSRLDPRLEEPLFDQTGTVGLWERLDRILGYKHPYSEAARKRLWKLSRDVEAHLEMVFHRFLAGDVRGRKIEMRLNANPITAWDPFARDEKATQILRPERFRVESDRSSGFILVQPYILPHESEFSSSEAFRRASGPARWNQQQGFYIYRANRMIQSGGWSRMRIIDEHTKLARIALDFLPELDDIFKVNVSKMRVDFPQELQNAMAEYLKPTIKKAGDAYRKRNGTPSSTSTEAGKGKHTHDGDAGIKKRLRNYEIKLWRFEELVKTLLQVATSSERPTVVRVVDRLRQQLE